MSSSIINKITEATGAKQISKEFVYNDIKRVCFDSDTEYSSIAEAAAEVNNNVDDRLVVWGCGVSEEGCPQVAIQRFESVDPNDVAGVDTLDSTPGPSGSAPVRGSFSIKTDGN